MDELEGNVDNRTNILACALQLFAWRGYDAVGVQEIVDMAGITKPTLYHYFGSKRGLLDTLVSEQLGELFDALDRAALDDGDLSLTLGRIVAAYFDYARSHRPFYRLQLSAWFAPPDSELFGALSHSFQRQHDLLEGVFAAGARGGIRGREHAVPAIFLGLINAYIGLALTSYAPLEEDLVYSVVHHFLHGILG